MSVSGHTFLRTHTLEAPLMRFDLKTEEAALRAVASRARSGRATKTLVKEGSLRIVLLALAKGGALAPHQAEGPVSIQVLRGSVTLSTAAGIAQAKVGSLMALDATVKHGVVAQTDASILITLAAR